MAMKSGALSWPLVLCLGLGAFPREVLAQSKTGESAGKASAQRLVPGQGTASVAPAAPTRYGVARGADPASSAGLGGRVYSTGLEEVCVRIIPVNKVAWKAETPYRSQIYLLGPGKKRLLGSNYDDRVVRLGRLPAGEIELGILPFGADAGAVRTGSGDRNPDGLPHAKVRAWPSGMVEVRFEDLLGLPEGRDLNSGNAVKREFAQRNFLSDVIVQFTGGVTADGAVLTVLESLKDPNPEVRHAAAATLRTGYPRIARSAGLP